MPTNEEHVTGVKIHTFPNETVENDALVTGLKTVNGALRNVNFTFATILTWVRQKIADFYIPLSTKGSANGVASLDGAGKVTDTQIPFSSNNPLMDGTASAGTATTLSRSDHRHPSDTSKISASEKGAASGVASLGADGKVPSAQLPTIPSASSATPQNLGTAAAGSSTDYSRADHVHNKPSAADINAQPTITASGILKGDGAGGVSAATPGTDYATPAQLAAKAPFSAGIFPGTSSTAGGTQAKVGTVPDLTGLTALYDGLTICMTFDNAQLYDGQPTLDIGIPFNGVTAFGINRTAASAAGIYDWGTGSAVDLVFDATNAVWVMKKGQHGSAVRYGVLLLSDSVSDASTVGGGKAATPAAVKAAYDLAAGKTATDVSYDTATHKIKKTVDGVTSVVATADTTPTANSDNLVTSGGVKAEIDTALANVLQQEILLVQISAVTSLPVTVTDDLITVDHVVLEAELGDPQAQTSEWTATTAAGSVTISGSISGTTSLRLILGKLNNPPE